jgi:glutaredoxin-related protein
MKEFLSNSKIKFLYLDITENMLNLKLFLKHRDNASEFDDIKASSRVGVPCIVINDGEQIIFDHTLLNIDCLKE